MSRLERTAWCVHNVQSTTVLGYMLVIIVIMFYDYKIMTTCMCTYRFICMLVEVEDNKIFKNSFFFFNFFFHRKIFFLELYNIFYYYLVYYLVC